MHRITSRTRARVLLLATASMLALAAPSAHAAYQYGSFYAGAVWTNTPGGFLQVNVDPVNTSQGANGAMRYFVQGNVNSWYCSSGYSYPGAQGSLGGAFVVTPVNASGTISGTAYDTCAGFYRNFQVTVNFTDTGTQSTTTNCCTPTGYNYLVAERDQRNGPGTVTFQWTPAFPNDVTTSGPTYDNAAIGVDLAEQVP